MPKLVVNRFSQYELTEQEALQGKLLTDANQAVLQNELASVAEQRIALVYDVTNPNKFLQEDAYLRGQMELIEYLMQSHSSALDVVANRNTTNQQEI